MKLIHLIFLKFITLFFLLFSINAYSQFSGKILNHFIFNKMNINPAFTANDINKPYKGIKLFIKNKFDQPKYNYFVGTFEMPVKKINSEIGILINYNNYLVYTEWNHRFEYSQFLSKIFYSYHLTKKLKIGISSGFVYQNSCFDMSNDPPSLTGPTKYTGNVLKFDMDAGVLFKPNNHLFFGSSVKNINNSSKEGRGSLVKHLYGYERSLCFMAGYTFNFKNIYTEIYAQSSHNIHSIYHMDSEVTLGSLLTFNNKLYTGISYKDRYGPNTGNLGVIVGCNILQNKIKISIGYDFSLNKDRNKFVCFDEQHQNIESMFNYNFIKN